MQSDQRPLKSPQHREPEAGDLADSPTGTAAPALGPPQLPRPAPGSERGSSPPPAPRLGPSVQPQQQEVGQGAAEQADGVQLRPSSAPPHAPSDPEAGGQEPAHLLEMLAEEACHESSVATDMSQTQQQQAAAGRSASLPDTGGPAPGAPGGQQAAAPPPDAAAPLAHGTVPTAPAASLQHTNPAALHAPAAAAGVGAARSLPDILQAMLSAQAWCAGLLAGGSQAQGPAAALHDWHWRTLEAAAAAAAVARAQPSLQSGQHSLAWQPEWHDVQPMDSAPHLQQPSGPGVVPQAHHAGHSQHAAAAAAAAAAAGQGSYSGPSHHHLAHGKRASLTAAAAVAAAAAATAEPAQPPSASQQQAQKWQMAAQIALRNLVVPSAAEEPSPRLQLARHYSAVTSREISSGAGSDWPGFPAGSHRPTGLKRSLTDLQKSHTSHLVGPHSLPQAAHPAQWFAELAAADSGNKRQAVAAAAEAAGRVAVPAGSASPLLQPPQPPQEQEQQQEQQEQQAQQQQQQQQQAAMDCTPSASPSRAPSGDSFAFPPKREPTPRSATAVAAAAAEPIGAAAAAGAPGRSGGATGAAAPAYDGDGPSALPLPGPAALAQPGAASATAMHKAAMLALQADALHRLRREFSKLLQLEMLIAMLERDPQQGGSPQGMSPITPQQLAQPLSSVQLSPHGSGSRQMAFQPSAGGQVALQPTDSSQMAVQASASAPMALQASGSTHMPPQGPGSIRLTLQPSSSLRLVLQNLGAAQPAPAAPQHALPMLPALTAAPQPAPLAAVGTAGTALGGELTALLTAMQRAGMRPEDVGQLQNLAAYLHRVQGSSGKGR